VTVIHFCLEQICCACEIPSKGSQKMRTIFDPQAIQQVLLDHCMPWSLSAKSFFLSSLATFARPSSAWRRVTFHSNALCKYHGRLTRQARQQILSSHGCNFKSTLIIIYPHGSTCYFVVLRYHIIHAAHHKAQVEYL